MVKKTVLLIVGTALLKSSLVFAESPMPIARIWEGPFNDTKVIKMIDQKAGVACYVYAPATVSWHFGESGKKL